MRPARRRASWSPRVLGGGFIVMSHALDHAGHNCNLLTQAESLVMTKEHTIDHYGRVRWTIGSGCSGGSLAQQQVANAYPGIYQGILPQCSFPDAWSSAMQYIEYLFGLKYFADPSRWDPGTVYEPAAIMAFNDHPNLSNPITFTTVIPNSGEPSRSCPGVPPSRSMTRTRTPTACAAPCRTTWSTRSGATGAASRGGPSTTSGSSTGSRACARA